MNAVLHVISDRTRHRLPLLDSLVEAAKGGADVIQVREKKAPASETYRLVRQLQDRLSAQKLSAGVFVNDRIDLAISADLAGVHLAAKSLPVRAAAGLRSRAGWSGRIGCSVHSLEEAVEAERAGADYVTYGHIFASDSHPGLPPRGLGALRRAVQALSIPVIAIGGIGPDNAGAVLDTGCSGVAVIGAVLGADNPREAAGALKRAMRQSGRLAKIAF